MILRSTQKLLLGEEFQDQNTILSVRRTFVIKGCCQSAYWRPLRNCYQLLRAGMPSPAPLGAWVIDPYSYAFGETLEFSKALFEFNHLKYNLFVLMPTLYSPIMKGTFSGILYLKNEIHFTFAITNENEFKITYAEGREHDFFLMNLNHLTGRVTLHWYHAVNPYDVKVVVTYEYDRTNKTGKNLPETIQQDVTIG